MTAIARHGARFICVPSMFDSSRVKVQIPPPRGQAERGTRVGICPIGPLARDTERAVL
jgi:hypothetical protein